MPWPPLPEAFPQTVREAAEWAALIDSRVVSAAQEMAYRQWRDADPMHRDMVDRMLGYDPLRGADDLERRALDRLIAPARNHRRLAGGAALGILLVVGVGLLSWQRLQPRDHGTEYRVAVGGQRKAALPDGSELVIDSGSTVRTETADGLRTVRLVRGRVLARVAHDPARPFVVQTRDGSVTALGTAFTVTREDDGTLVEVSSSRVRACAAGGDAPCAQLGPGDRARISGGQVRPLRRVPAATVGQWSSGWLEVDDQPVAEVIDTLNRYRTQPLRYDPVALAGIRVTGSYPLAQPDRALKAIGRTPGAFLVRDADGSWRLVAGAAR